jgi:hypothetical protein
MQWQPLVLLSYRGDSRAVFVVGPVIRAVNKRHDNKLENCCIWLVIYLNWFVLCFKALCYVPTGFYR